MAISHVGSNLAGATGSTSITVNNPAGVAVDDLLIVQGTLSRTGTAFQNASYTGWTILRDETQLVDGSLLISRIVYRFADGTGTDAPPTFSTATSGNTIATVGVYRGVDKTSPFITDNYAVTGTTSTTHTAPVLNNTVTGAWGVFFGASRQVASPQSWSANSPMVQRQSGESGAANTNNAAHLLSDTNGAVATGNHTWSGSTSVTTAVATVWAGLLRPAAAGGTTHNAVLSVSAVGDQLVVNATRTQPAVAPMSATASASFGGVRTQPAVLAVRGTPILAVSGTNAATQSAVLSAAASSTLTLGTSINRVAAVATAATSTLTLGPLKTSSAVLVMDSVEALTIGALRTQFAVLPVSGATTLSVAAQRSQFATLGVSALAAVSVSVVSGQSAQWAPGATPTFTIAGSKAVSGILAAQASPVLVINGVRLTTAVWTVRGTPVAVFGQSITKLAVLTMRGTPVLVINGIRIRLSTLSMSAASTLIMSLALVTPDYRTHDDAVANILIPAYVANLLGNGQYLANLLTDGQYTVVLANGNVTAIIDE